MNKKIYIIRKYVLAKTLQEAIRLDKTSKIDDCWAEDNVHKDYLENIYKNQIGFKAKI